MKKSDAEPKIRHLCHVWATEMKHDRTAPDYNPSFPYFTTWMFEKGYGHYLDFRSRAGARYDAEMWFDEELGQSWRR